ncbi:dihydroneopterin aldolase domain protein [Aspergillus campestris IBT 28561]|uniref:dihydroneopterin aldolase n=1 Tax=Aspergillus campestris (strain IBT 28561) TaxID=1392248 RepID=A0A2I1DF13_ASPC2|nr:dihydroneopterin aldolase domain protein [Aspergillus campestris IBT 28561]PKY08448.1 dihydroneopterin aldolase domain protein [Aspergillus campestris IBT 28561]
MSEQRRAISLSPVPAIVDTISLRNVQLPLPSAPEAWHRLGKRQPCTVSVRLSYSSATGAAAADDVSLSLDYGKLYRRAEQAISGLQQSSTSARLLVNQDGSLPERMTPDDAGQDLHCTAGIIASCAFDLLVEVQAQAPDALQGDFGRCDVHLHLPKALLRADGGLIYRAQTAMVRGGGPITTVILSEEFRIQRIRCFAILGINPHERLEKQAVLITLTFQSPAQNEWRSNFLRTYPEMTRTIAETVDKTDFQSVEALATLVARIAVVDFGHSQVTALVEKPNALAFSEGTGVEITRSQSFFS